MKEYTINLREDGSAVIAKSYWNPDKSFKAMEEKPYLFEVGQKVVDIFSNVVTIKEIHKHPSVNGEAPQWTLNVEENNNTYVYYELAGIFVREVPAYEIEAFLKKELLSWLVSLVVKTLLIILKLANGLFVKPGVQISYLSQFGPSSNSSAEEGR